MNNMKTFLFSIEVSGDVQQVLARLNNRSSVNKQHDYDFSYMLCFIAHWNQRCEDCPLGNQRRDMIIRELSVASCELSVASWFSIISIQSIFLFQS